MILRYLYILSLILLGTCDSWGQIFYKIDLLNGEDLYQVSLISSQDYSYPNNKIGTAQVSIKAPIIGFELGEINSNSEDIQWTLNSKIDGPEEAQLFQYLSFTLNSVGSTLPLTENTVTPLFTFKNKIGKCPGEVSLVDNQTDSFMPPNSRNANIGNQITPLGNINSRNNNAYLGNINDGVASCEQLTSLNSIERELLLDMELSPNPTHDWLNLDIQTTNTSEDIVIQIWEKGGKLIKQEVITRPFSTNIKKQEDFSAFASGNYSIILSQGNNTKIKHFVKVIR